MKMGIIGAENSHAAAIATLINVKKKIKGFKVTHLWGETAVFSNATAEKGQIPTIVKRPEEMIGHVDCVMIDHRDGKYHLPIATKFINAGIPVFIDKPLSTSLSEAKKFLSLRKKKKIAVTTLSAMPHQKSFSELSREIDALECFDSISMHGSGDYKSQYSGLFFYAIHQVDMMISIMKKAPEKVLTTVNGKSCTTICSFPDNTIVTITITPNVNSFYITAIGKNASIHKKIETDKDVYSTTTKMFTRMFTTGVEPYDDSRMLMPIAVLEAMTESLKKRQWIQVVKL